MRLWDVNLWVYAFRADSPLHEKAKASIQGTLDRRENFLFSPALASSFLRLVTNPRIFKRPSELAEAWLFLDALQSRPGARFVEMDEMAFGIFKHLGIAATVVGNAVPDAYLAAVAIRHDALLVTADRDFSRFKGLRTEFIA